ncbi:MAG: RiPP maturation radical SAM C-methyltransferase [Devosia sp.]
MNRLLESSKNSRSSQDVCFINMPLSGLERPSIGLGQLQTLLQNAGIATKSVYANLWFAEYFGIDLTRILQTVPPEEAVVDWLFGAAAFPDFEPDHDAYLSLISERAPQLARGGLSASALLDLRGKMVAFTDWTARKILQMNPRIVGCTSTFQQHVPALALLRRLRALAPEVVTMMGGANCESTMGKTTHAQFAWVDYVVSGEADGLIVPLIKDVLNAAGELAAPALPFGVFAPVHRRSGYPVTDQGDGVPRAVTEDVSTLPLPQYDDYFEELQHFLYGGVVKPGLPMEFSRGCWWGAKSHCTFCGLNGGSMAYRAKPSEKVVADMIALSGKYAVDKIEVVDNIMDMAYFKTVLPELSALDRPFRLFFETKANLKKEQVKALSDAGVNWIQPGIESLDSRILSLMGKGCTAAQNILLLKWCRQYGVRVSWSIITNFPGEEDSWYQTMAAIVPLLAHLQPGNIVPLRYDRYSPYFTTPERHGLKLKAAERYRFAYPLNTEDLFSQVYFFENEGAGDTADRPGLRMMQQAMKAWVQIWRTQELPVLLMHETAEGLIVEDSRAGGETHCLAGVRRAVMELADDGPPEHQLMNQLQTAGYAAAQIAGALRELEDQALLIRLDGRVIGLALRKHYVPLPSPTAFPGGNIAAGYGLMESLVVDG